MTILELLRWINAAQDWHEKNWTEAQLGTPLRFQSQAMDATRPANANSVDIALACYMLRELWSDSQTWLEEYQKVAPQVVN